MTAGPAPVEPDTKDWTWVLDRPCPECGLDTRGLGRDDIAPALRDVTDGWVALLGRLDADEVRRRPQPQVWSPLEYGCHVRDVFGLYDERLRLMLTVDEARFPNWDQDVAAVEYRYDRQDPRQVSVDLAAAGETLAAAFAGVAGEQWQRTGYRSDGASFTVETFARYLVHDPVHHLHDVTDRGR